MAKKLIHLLYIGTYLAKMHLVSYVASMINGILWFALVFGPTVVFSPDPVKALRTFLPGTIGFTAASMGMWVSTEFLRWYVYQGLTDMFRECGLNVFHYLVAGIHIDILLDVVPSYFITTSFAALYIGIDPSIAMPSKPDLFLLALALAFPTYILCGSLIAYLYTVTPIGGAWTNILQMACLVGTILPPTTLPIPELALLNPATIVAELARASYGTNTLNLDLLLVLAPVLFVVYTAIAYTIAKLCDRYIARHGIRYRM